MFHVILVCPEIPPNTGNVIRLAANTGVSLHLVRPLGFALDDARLRRAGLDYHEWADLRVHDSLPDALAATGSRPDRRYALTTGGRAAFAGHAFEAGDVFVFGRETSGLSAAEVSHFPPEQRLRLPMRPGQRSLNLSNAVAVTVFEAWRQCGYAGGVHTDTETDAVAVQSHTAVVSRALAGAEGEIPAEEAGRPTQKSILIGH